MQFLAHVRTGEVLARGAQGSAPKWAHAAIALAARSLGAHAGEAPGRPDPARVLGMVRRLLVEADARHGSGAGDLTPADARCLLRAWLQAVELDHLDERGLIAFMQDDRFSHSDLYPARMPRARAQAARSGDGGAGGRHRPDGALRAAGGLFEACTAAIPYAPATAFLANEQAKLAAIPDSLARQGAQRAAESRRDDGETPRVAIVADGIGSTHGVTRTIEEIRERGVPDFEIEVVGTDPEVDRRLAAVCEFEVPFYPAWRIGVPSLPAAVQTLADGCYEAIHVCSPGPAGIAGALVARALGLPLVGSYHTELTAYAGLRSGEQRVAATMAMAVGAFYGACDVVLSPSSASDRALAQMGMPAERVLRWDRGVDTSRFDPRLGSGSLLPESINVMYSGRVTREKGADLLVEAFLRARAGEPRLHLVVAGGGPEQERVRERLGSAATFLGWLQGEELARAYASADIFMFPSATDTFGQVILEAQASGLPVLAVARGGPLSLVEHRVTGLLCEPDPEHAAAALLELAGSPLLRRRLAATALAAVRARTWERTLERLAAGYNRALRGADGTGDVSTQDVPDVSPRAA